MIDHGKQNVLGILVDALDYDAAVARIISAAHEGRGYAVTALAGGARRAELERPQAVERVCAREVAGKEIEDPVELQVRTCANEVRAPNKR